MVEKLSLSDEQIIDCLCINYGIEVTKLDPLSGGADLNASVYKAKARDQSSYFVKLKQGPFQDISVALQELLQEAGIEQIIPPLKTTSGNATHRVNDSTLIVYPFVEGLDGFSQNLTKDQWFILGKVLRQIHEIRVPSFIQEKIRHEDYSPKWREAVRFLSAQREGEQIRDEMAQKFKTFVEEKAAVIHRLVDRSEQLAQNLRRQSHPFVLCHSDLHGGNVLINEKGHFFIVDWDDPIIAPKERDLMFIGGGVGNVWNKPEEIKAFYQGYGETKINRELLTYYRYERIVEDIALYCQHLLYPAVDGQDRFKAYNQFVAQFCPHGVVEIAFKTDEGLALVGT